MNPVVVLVVVLLLTIAGLIDSKRRLAIVALGLSLIMTGAGGYIDMTGRNIYTLTREHAWNDGLYLALVSVAVSLL